VEAAAAGASISTSSGGWRTRWTPGRRLLVGTAGGFTTADDALATSRRCYPGGPHDVEQAFVIDWAKAPGPWPASRSTTARPAPAASGRGVIEPEGRVYFVGA